MPSGITNALYGGFPGVRIKGFDSALRFGGGWPKIIGPDGVLTILDHISSLRGKHAFKLGGALVSNWSTVAGTPNAKRPAQFNATKGVAVLAVVNFVEGSC